MGSGKIKTENYYCGYKSIIFNPYLHLIMFFYNILYIGVFIFILWKQEIKKKTTKETKFWVFNAEDILWVHSCVIVVYDK